MDAQTLQGGYWALFIFRRQYVLGKWSSGLALSGAIIGHLFSLGLCLSPLPESIPLTVAG